MTHIDHDTQFISNNASEEQKATLEKSKGMGQASLKLSWVIRDLSEAAGRRSAILFQESKHITKDVEETRQRAIQELLECIEILGGHHGD